MGRRNWRWGVILDAGSSGTRLHIYRWKDPEKVLKDGAKQDLHRLPKVYTKKDWTKKISPGISTFGEDPAVVGPEHLQSLIDHAIRVIPRDKVSDTPVFLMATAGMRLLPQAQQSALTRHVCTYFQQHTHFSLPDCSLHIQVIPGETEGLYGWIALNYLLGGFDHADRHNHGKGHNTYGFLDMGGASAQIAFAPNTTEAEKHANDLKLLRLRTMDGTAVEYRVFTTTWLGFGVNQARNAYVQKLREIHADPESRELPDPCLPAGLRTTLEGKPVVAGGENLTLVGTAKFDECLKLTHPLLGKDKPCEDDPCLLNGQHVPAIDFEVNHFVGVSEFWHTTHGVFGGKQDKAYDFTTYMLRVKEFCSQDWQTIESSIDNRKNGVKYALEACFKASWLINVLHDGIGIPRIGLEKLPGPGLNSSKGALGHAKDKGFLDPFQPVDKIDGIEVSWTLGKMLLYAAGQIPPKTHDDTYPVGFGSNVLGVVPDFQVAGSTWRPLKHSNQTDDEEWGETAEDLLDKAKVHSPMSILGFILVLVLVLFIFRKRDRRIQAVGRMTSFLRRSRRPGSPGKNGRRLANLTSKFFGRSSASYERILEEGEADSFELGGRDSNENEYSDSTESVRVGRSSGLATTKLKHESLDPISSGSALDRSRLVDRTESRERLTPTLVMHGRRSRCVSPTRLRNS